DGLVMVGLMALAIAAPSFPRDAVIGGTSVSRVAGGGAIVFGAALLVALAVVHRPAPWLSFFNRITHGVLPARLADRLVRLAAGLLGRLEVLRRPGGELRDHVPPHHVLADHHPRLDVADPRPRPPGRAADRRAYRGVSVAAPEQVRLAAHAKVNLFLRILAREHGGGEHHQIETALALLELADEVVAVRRGAPGEVSLTVNGPDLGPAEEN